jgi:hypothetical protein
MAPQLITEYYYDIVQKHLLLYRDRDNVNMYSQDSRYVIYVNNSANWRFGLRNVTSFNTRSIFLPNLRVLLKMARLYGI